MLTIGSDGDYGTNQLLLDLCFEIANSYANGCVKNRCLARPCLQPPELAIQPCCKQYKMKRWYAISMLWILVHVLLKLADCS